MQNKKCKEAVEAYKNALRNNPSDDETRYNLSVAKICAEEQQKQEDQNKDDKKDQDKKDENKEDQDKKDNKDKEGENKEDKKDEGDQEKKEGEDEKDEDGKPKDEKKDKGKGDEDKKKEQQKPQPQPGQLSPQQIKNLLEAMNNQEQKVQEKMNAELKNLLDDMGLKAKKASSILNTSSTHQKNSFFDFAIKAIQQDADNILEANQLDIKQAKENKKDAVWSVPTHRTSDSFERQMLLRQSLTTQQNSSCSLRALSQAEEIGIY